MYLVLDLFFGHIKTKKCDCANRRRLDFPLRNILDRVCSVRRVWYESPTIDSYRNDRTSSAASDVLQATPAIAQPSFYRLPTRNPFQGLVLSVLWYTIRRTDTLTLHGAAHEFRNPQDRQPVSYTHLTLPTIYSV